MTSKWIENAKILNVNKHYILLITNGYAWFAIKKIQMNNESINIIL
jgi:hypothetical protein